MEHGRVWRVAVLGLGGQGRRLAKQLEASGRFAVVATFDPAGTSFRGAAACESAAACVGREEVEAVYVASPPARHEEGLALALAARKPVLLEKPLAHSLAAARRMAAAVAGAGAGALAAVNFWPASSSQGRAVLERVAEWGPPAQAALRARFPAWPRPFQVGGRNEEANLLTQVGQAKAGSWLASAEEGGGPVREVGSHFVWLAVRAQGGDEAAWRVAEREVERGASGLERRVRARAEGPGGAALSLDVAVGAEDAEKGTGKASEEETHFELAWSGGRRAGLRDWLRVEGAPQPPHDELAEARAFARLLDERTPAALPTVAEALCVARVVEDMLATESIP